MSGDDKLHATSPKSIEVGVSVDGGCYECAACGYRVHMKDGETLPTCPEDQGLHAIQAWCPVDDDQCHSQSEAEYINAPATIPLQT